MLIRYDKLLRIKYVVLFEILKFNIITRKGFESVRRKGEKGKGEGKEREGKEWGTFKPPIVLTVTLIHSILHHVAVVLHM